MKSVMTPRERVLPRSVGTDTGIKRDFLAMDLTLVSQWLGYAQLKTTLIYARADIEHKRKVIAAAVPSDSPLKSFAPRFASKSLTRRR